MALSRKDLLQRLQRERGTGVVSWSAAFGSAFPFLESLLGVYGFGRAPGKAPRERLSCAGAWVLIAPWLAAGGARWTWVRAEPLACYVGVSLSACQCHTNRMYQYPVWHAGSPLARNRSHEFHRWVHTLLINTSRSLDWELLKLKSSLLLHASKRSPLCFVPLWAGLGQWRVGRPRGGGKAGTAVWAWKWTLFPPEVPALCSHCEKVSGSFILLASLFGVMMFLFCK